MALLPQSRKRKPYIHKAWDGIWRVYYPQANNPLGVEITDHPTWREAWESVTRRLTAR